ncbi:hypothetical protein BJX66DRAFT_312528 [Aspergillus keveii]|uniref:Complex 1 LYR protein domain-containing protein n=1 Tax=Aspergillus keveii TaxID=714993 RepID=A0ABR4FTF7_9EURO
MSVSALQRDTAFQARSLFRSLLRQSSQFSNYNFREYALRRTKDAFREHQHETQERRIQELIQEGLQSLRMMKVCRNIPGAGAPYACRYGVGSNDLRTSVVTQRFAHTVFRDKP